MTLVAVILYSLATILWIVLLWLYTHPGKKESRSEDVNKRHTPRKRKYRGQASFLEAIGLFGMEAKPFYYFDDHFRSFYEVSEACKKAGLETCGLILGIDFTASNEWQGRKSFNGSCLHKLVPGKIHNPYQKVISIMGQTLEPFDDDKSIPTYGFGDSLTLGNAVFPFHNDQSSCAGFNEVLELYGEYASKLQLSGPTNFAPVINQAIEIVKEKQSYHILIIIADGQVNEEDETAKAVIQASNYPLSIVVVGVGDGPWDLMQEFDNHLPNRIFDNFQFVNYHEATSRSKHPDAALALHVMMEIPLQYKTIKSMGYLPSKVISNSKEVLTSKESKETDV